MPGSRRREISALLAPMLDAARRLQQRDPRLQFALPLASSAFRREIEAAVRASGVHDVAIYRPRSYAVLSRARVALQCSGTATLETALLGIPSVIVYRCLAIEYMAARCFMHVDFIGMPNILLGEMVQPELLQRRADAEHMAQAVWTLLTDKPRWHAIHARLGMLREVLGAPGAYERAAGAILDLLPAPRNSKSETRNKSDKANADLLISSEETQEKMDRFGFSTAPKKYIHR